MSVSEWECAIYSASRSSSESRLDRLLSDCPSIFTQAFARSRWDFAHPSPVHAAARKGSANAIRLLCESGFSCNCVEVSSDGSSPTPLHVAVEVGSKAAIKQLLHHGADQNQKQKIKGQVLSPLELAMSKGSLRTVSVFMEHSLMQDRTNSIASAEILDVALREIHNKDMLESELEAASGVWEQIDRLEERLQRADAAGIAAEINALRSSKHFRTKACMDQMLSELETLDEMERELRARVASSLSSDISCVLCSSVPKEDIYVCQSCPALNSFMCGSCAAAALVCSDCGQDLADRPPKRCQWAERIVAKIVAE